MHGLREGQPEGMVILDGLRKESVRYGMFNITTWLMAVIFFFINIAVQGPSPAETLECDVRCTT